MAGNHVMTECLKFISRKGDKAGRRVVQTLVTVWSLVSSKIPLTYNSISMHLLVCRACIWPGVWPSVDQCQKLWLSGVILFWYEMCCADTFLCPASRRSESVNRSIHPSIKHSLTCALWHKSLNGNSPSASSAFGSYPCCHHDNMFQGWQHRWARIWQLLNAI